MFYSALFLRCIRKGETTLQEENSQALIIPQQFHYSIEQTFLLWLDSLEADLSKKRYERVFIHLRKTLQHFGLDYDSDTVAISLVIQGWAARFHPQVKDEQGQEIIIDDEEQQETPIDAADQVATLPNSGTVEQKQRIANNTFNNRVAIISSFYRFAKRRRLIKLENPTELLDRKRVRAYEHAEALDFQELAQILGQIDRTKLPGKRDYALLLIAATTGRRVGEIAAMHWQHIKIKNTKRLPVISIYFPHMKGGKSATNDLEFGASRALLEWLYAFYGADIASLPANAPVWVSLARNKTLGHQLTIRSMQYIALKYIKTGKFHTLRSTFAVTMDEAGASTSYISEALAHSNIGITSVYLKSAKKKTNKHLHKLEEMYGATIEEEEEG